MPLLISEASIKFVESIIDFTVTYTAYFILLEKVWDGRVKQALKNDSVKCTIMSSLDRFK